MDQRTTWFTWHDAQRPETPPSNPSEPVLADNDELRCAYSSKKCTNVRTTKKGGGLHRFCEFHRRRANRNQWRVDDKRRALRAQRRQQLKRLRAAAATATAVTVAPPPPTPATTHDPLRQDPKELLLDEIPLTTEEIKLLQAILFDDDGVDLKIKARQTLGLAPSSPSCVGAVIV